MVEFFIALVFVENFEKMNIYVAILLATLDSILLYMQLDEFREISIFETIVKTIEETITEKFDYNLDK